MLNLEQRAIVAASGLYLTQRLPESYVDMTDAELDKYFTVYVQQDYEDYDLNYLWEVLTESARELVRFHIKELELVLGEAKSCLND